MFKVFTQTYMYSTLARNQFGVWRMKEYNSLDSLLKVFIYYFHLALYQHVAKCMCSSLIRSETLPYSEKPLKCLKTTENLLTLTENPATSIHTHTHTHTHTYRDPYLTS